MEIGSRSAQRLYGQALDVSKPAAAPGPDGLRPFSGELEPGGVVAGAPGGDFSATVGQAAAETIDALRGGEQAAAAMMAGKADPHSVVEALAAAEMALEMAVTVRDKVVEAYQEILRMPV